MSCQRDNIEDERIELSIIDTTFSIIVDEYFEYFDLDNIQSVDDIKESLHEYLNMTGHDRDFNLDNIINYYNFKSLFHSFIS